MQTALKKSCIRLFRHDEKVYLKIWHKSELLFAEVMFAPAPEDLLYFVAAIVDQMPHARRVNRFPVVATALTDGDMKLLKRYYKVRCES